MLIRGRRLGLALTACLLLAMGNAGEAADLAQIKRALIEAAEAADAPAARTAARSYEGDPWYLLDALLADGELAAARLFTEIVESGDRDRLREAVRAAPPEDAVARAAFVRAQEGGARGDYRAAVEALGSLDPPAGSILRARFYFFKALSFLRLKKKDAARASFEHAVTAGHGLGWGWMEAQARRGALACMRLGDDPAVQVPHLLRLHALREYIGEKSLVAKFEDWLGKHLDALGEAGAAGAHLALASELYDDAHMRVRAAQAAGNAALAMARSGNYADALDWLRRAASHWREDEDGVHYAYFLAQAGAVYTEVGNYEQARDLLQRAAQGLQDEGDAADVLGQIGLLELLTANHDAAAKAVDRALHIYQRLEAKTDVGRAHRMLGKIAYQGGQYDRAILEFEAALRLAEDDPWSAMQARVGLGRAWAAQKKFERAAASLRRAASEAEVSSAREVQFEAVVGLADLHLRRGAPKQALALALQAIDLLGHIAENLSDEPMARVRARRSEPFSITLRAALTLGDVSAGVHAIERWRARALLDALGGRHALREATLPAELAEAEAVAARQWAVELRALESARRARRRLRELRRLAARADAAERHYLEAVRTSRRAAKRVAAITHPEPRDGAAIQRDLAKGEALVLFTVYGERIGAYVLTSGAGPGSEPKIRWVDLGGRGKAEERCLALVRAWSTDSRADEELTWIRKNLLAKLKLPAAVERVFIVPDGQLSYLPWPVVLEGKDVACVPSGTVLSLLRAEPRVESRRFFALGDPVYQRGGVPLHPGSRGRFRRLVGSGAEAKKIAAGKRDTLLLRENATERRVRAALADEQGYAAAQFGCHGVVPSNAPALSALVVTPAGEDDGFLTSVEVLGMRIRANLVTLSACDLGHGEFVPGEGLLGLPRAFIVAGVPRVLVALWPVDDAATEVLMGEFYRQWKAGRPTAEALRIAQDAVKGKKQWSHPSNWAAWVIWGLPD